MKTFRNLQDCYCDKCMCENNIKIRMDKKENEKCCYYCNNAIIALGTSSNRKASNKNTKKRGVAREIMKKVHKRSCQCLEKNPRHNMQTNQKVIQISQEDYRKNIISRRNKSRHVIEISSNNYSSFHGSNIMNKKNDAPNTGTGCSLNHVCSEKENQREMKNKEKASDCRQTSSGGNDSDEHYTTIIFIERSGVGSNENNTSSTNESSVSRYIIKKKPGMRPKLIYNNGLSSETSNKTCQSHSFDGTSATEMELTESVQKTTDFEKESTVTESSGNISDIERRDDPSTYVMEQTDDCILDETDSYLRGNKSLTGDESKTIELKPANRLNPACEDVKVNSNEFTELLDSENSMKKTNNNQDISNRNMGVARTYRRCNSSIHCLNFTNNLESFCKELPHDTFVVREKSTPIIISTKDAVCCTESTVHHDLVTDANKFEELEVQTSTLQTEEKGTANSKVTLQHKESRSTSPLDFETEVLICTEDSKTQEVTADSCDEDNVERNLKVSEENIQTKHLKKMSRVHSNRLLCQCGDKCFKKGVREYSRDVINDDSTTIHPVQGAKRDVTVMHTKIRRTFDPNNEPCTSRYFRASSTRVKPSVPRKGMNAVPRRRPLKRRSLKSSAALSLLRQLNRIGTFVTSKLSKPKETQAEPEILKLKLVIPAEQNDVEVTTLNCMKSESTMRDRSEISKEISVQTSMDKENGSNTSETRLKPVILEKTSVSQSTVPRCDKWTNKALMLDKECQLGNPNLSDKGVSAVNLIDSNNAEVQVAFKETLKNSKHVNKERDSIINSIYQTREESSDSYGNASMDDEKKSPFSNGYGFREPLVLLMNPLSTKPDAFGKSLNRSNEKIKTASSTKRIKSDRNFEKKESCRITPTDHLGSQMSDLASKKIEIINQRLDVARENKNDEYLSESGMLTQKVYSALYQSVLLVAPKYKCYSGSSEEMHSNKSKPLKSTIIHIRKDTNPVNQDAPKCHFSESFTQTWLKSLTHTAAPKTDQDPHEPQEEPRVTIEDNEYLKAYHLAQMKKHLVESCRYFSNIVSRQLDKVKEKVTKELMTSCHKYMEQVNYETAGTMKPSGRMEFTCQTFEEVESCKNTSKDLYTALSLTKIFSDEEKESLKSQYYLLSAIDGRLRRIKKRNCASFY